MNNDYLSYTDQIKIMKIGFLEATKPLKKEKNKKSTSFKITLAVTLTDSVRPSMV